MLAPSNGPISWTKEAGRRCPLHPLVLSFARVDFFTRQGFKSSRGFFFLLAWIFYQCFFVLNTTGNFFKYTLVLMNENLSGRNFRISRILGPMPWKKLHVFSSTIEKCMFSFFLFLFFFFF